MIQNQIQEAMALIQTSVSDSLKKMLDNRLNDKPVGVLAVKGAVEEALGATGAAMYLQGTPRVQARTLWQAMGWRLKIKWFMYNRFPFKKQGAMLREFAATANRVAYDAWREGQENRARVSQVSGVLWPNGDKEHEWDSSTLDAVSEAMDRDYGTSADEFSDPISLPPCLMANPKGTILVDMMFHPKKPLTYIDIVVQV